jgi:hypothetical protein
MKNTWMPGSDRPLSMCQGSENRSKGSGINIQTMAGKVCPALDIPAIMCQMEGSIDQLLSNILSHTLIFSEKILLEYKIKDVTCFSKAPSLNESHPSYKNDYDGQIAQHHRKSAIGKS